MKEKERLIAIGLVVLMLIVWLGFVFHHSPRFAGSLWGGVLGVTGALLMLVPLAYLFVKRIKRLKEAVKNWVSMRTLLAWHIYAGILGPILVLIHTGHKFDSLLGIALTTMTLIVVLSGFVGRYLMSQFSQEIREKKALLQQLSSTYEAARIELAANPVQAAVVRPYAGFFSRLAGGLFVEGNPTPTASVATSPGTLLRLAEAIADVEYAIRTHESFKRWFGKWLKLHIVISFVLYGLMALHVWAAIYFGLRWFEPTAPIARAQTLETATGIRLSTAGNGAPSRVDPNESDQLDALSRFSDAFGQMFRQHWRAPVTIRGTRTTVFDYSGIAKEVSDPSSNFSAALQALSNIQPPLLHGDDTEKAFWINAYNFGAMKLAAEHYPVPSIIDPKISADDPWGVNAVQIGSNGYTLQQIENAILLKKFDDPRIAFAISCAAVSCPDRSDSIFSGEQIDSQLDALCRGLFANPTKGLKIDRDRKIVTTSWILKADQRLFGGNDQGVLEFVGRYTTADIRSWINANANELTVEYFEHDWGLNDIAAADSGT